LEPGSSDHAKLVICDHTIENTHTGLEFLVEELKRLAGGVIVGLEATGHYWLSLYDVSTRYGYAVVVINPLHIAAYRKSGVRKVCRLG
jgi:transposase